MLLGKEGIQIKMDLRSASDEIVFAESLRNPDLYEVIVNRYKKAFLRKVAPIVAPIGGLTGAEDIVQEAFVKIYLKGNSFASRGEGSFKSWAYAVLMNTCFSAYRKARREKLVSLEEYEDVVASIPIEEDTSSSKFSLDLAVSLIAKLPDTLKRVADWYFIKGKSHSDIAVLEKTTEGAIRTRLHRAREIIKKLGQELDVYR